MRRSTRRLYPRRGGILCWLLIGSLYACRSESAPVPAPGEPAPRAAEVITTPPIAELSAPAVRQYSGTVVTRLPAGSYTYLEIAVADARRWAVTTGGGAEVGERVHAEVFGTREDFASPRLGRRFAHLDFATVEPD